MSVTASMEFFFQLHVTSRCNLTCRHCYQRESAGEEVTLREIENTVDEFDSTLDEWRNSYGINLDASWNVTGGEPFLREDLFQILDIIARRGFHIYLLTNGTLLSGDRARRLAQVPVKGVQVSVEGPEPIHDRIRGEGSFSKALSGISTLLNIGHLVTMNVTLSRINAPYFMDMIGLARSLGVHNLGFSRIVPCGKGASMSQHMLSIQEVQSLYENLAGLDLDNLNLVTGDPVASCLFNPETNEVGDDVKSPVAIGGCAAGISGITIMPDGTLLPCRRLDVPIGNIRTDSFRELWASSPVLLKLRDKSLYPGRCGQCQRWSVCRGCRAIAYASSCLTGDGDILADDPQCFFHPDPELQVHGQD